MKSIFKLFVPVTVAAIALFSCQKEIQVPVNPDTVYITVTAEAQDFANEGTKTYIGTYQGTANTILWGTGESMKLAVTAGESTSFANSSETDSFYGEKEATFGFSVSPGEASEYVFQGIYPASSAVANSNNNPTAYKVKLPEIQNATAESYDPAAYIMVAQPETFSSVQTSWKASFRRATALNKITLKNVPSGVSIKRVEITTPTGKYLAGARHIDLSSGESNDIYSGGGRTETVEVKFATALSGTNVDVWFTSWDVEVEAGETLTIVAYTTAKTSYTKTITVPSGKSIKFQEGFLNTLGASLSGITPDDVTELEDGNYVILAKNDDNYYAMKAETVSNDTRMASIAYTGSLSSYNGDADMIWNVSKSGSSYILANSGKYLGFSGSDNKAFWNEAGSSWTTDNYLIDIVWDSSSNSYHATLNSNDQRKLSRNSGSDWFAFYTSDQQKDLIFVPATVDSRYAVTLIFEDGEQNETDAVALTTATYNTFLGLDLVASPNVTAITNNISWTYEDNDGVIDEFDDGALTLTGTAGTATVTASFAGDENYRAAEASYTITVSAVSGPQYELVSTANDVVAGDYIITWNNSYYLPSGSTSGTNPAVGTGITVSNNKITNTVTSAMVWTFTGDNTNGFTISDGTNILHSTNAAQGISINTNSARKWTVSVDGTYGMLLHGDDGGTRNLAVYNNATWRYYATGGSYSGTLRLYKLADNRDEAEMSWSAENATATYNTGNSLSFSAPTLDPGNATSITYSSSDETIATISNAGVVSINLTGNDVKEGSTTISAVFAGDDDYKAQTVSYTLNVVDSRSAVATPGFSPAAGEVAADTEVSFTCAEDGVTYYYTVDNSEPTTASSSASSVIIDVAKTVKVIAIKTGYKPSAVATAAYTIQGVQSNDGSLEHPYTADEAYDIINGYSSNSGSDGSKYVTGTVVSVTGLYNSTMLNYYISSDGTSTKQIQVFRGKFLGNTNFSSADQVKAGDEVIVYGQLYKYNSTIEINTGNYLYSINGKTKALTAGSLTATPDNANKQIAVTWGAATGSSEAISYVVTCGAQTYNANAAGNHTFTMADYGSYSISVVASATDAVSATVATTATLTDPSAGTNYYVKVSSITAGKHYLIVGGGTSKVLVPSTGSGRKSSADVTISNDKIESTATVDAYAVTIIANGTYYDITFTSGNTTNYLQYNSSTNLTTATSSSNTKTWDVVSGTYGSFRFKDVSTASASTKRGLVFRGGSTNQFGGYSLSNVNGNEYYDIDLYEYDGN